MYKLTLWQLYKLIENSGVNSCFCSLQMLCSYGQWICVSKLFIKIHLFLKLTCMLVFQNNIYIFSEFQISPKRRWFKHGFAASFSFSSSFFLGGKRKRVRNNHFFTQKVVEIPKLSYKTGLIWNSPIKQTVFFYRERKI